jgi:hypothetical protein
MKESHSEFARLAERRKVTKNRTANASDEKLDEQLLNVSRQISALSLLLMGMQKYLSTLPDWDEDRFDEIVRELDASDGWLDGMLNGPTKPSESSGTSKVILPKDKPEPAHVRLPEDKPTADNVVLPNEKRFPVQPEE